MPNSVKVCGFFVVAVGGTLYKSTTYFDNGPSRNLGYKAQVQRLAEQESASKFGSVKQPPVLGKLNNPRALP
jgi:hypothetical protein